MIPWSARKRRAVFIEFELGKRIWLFALSEKPGRNREICRRPERGRNESLVHTFDSEAVN